MLHYLMLSKTPGCVYSYVQMLSAIDAEMRHQIRPFLEAGIVPDVVVLENEGSSGMLYDIKLPNGDTYSRCSHTQMHACCDSASPALNLSHHW